MNDDLIQREWAVETRMTLGLLKPLSVGLRRECEDGDVSASNQLKAIEITRF